MDANSKAFLALVAATALLAIPAGAWLAGPSAASHLPANKIAVAGGTLEEMVVQAGKGSTSDIVDLLAAEMRTSSLIDLLVGVTLECAIFTDVSVTGNDESEATATVRVWVEVDGAPIPVSDDDDEDGDVGRVVFCNRDYKLSITDLDDPDATFEHYLRSRAANAFNWVRFDVPSGVHDIVVKAQLEAEVAGVGEARAIVGKRTLVAEPEYLATEIAV